MKKLEAMIRFSKLNNVTTALDALGVHGMTVTEISGFGRQRGHQEAYRGAAHEVRFVPKVKVEILVRDEDLDTVLSAVMQAARTGEAGDGKIFIIPVEDVVRVRTGERGNAAI